MKKYKVDIKLASFNYDHIEAENEDKAMDEAVALVEERYPWAKIESISATEIDE